MSRWTTVLLVMAGVILSVLLIALTQLRATPVAQPPVTQPPVAQPPVDYPPPLAGSTPAQAAVGGDYARQAARAQEALAAAMLRVGALMGEPRLDDPAWLDEVTLAMEAVDAAYAALARLEPPAPLQAFHRRLLAGVADCSAAMRVLGLAPEERQPAIPAVAAALLHRCQRTLTEAQTLADEAAGSRGTTP